MKNVAKMMVVALLMGYSAQYAVAGGQDMPSNSSPEVNQTEGFDRLERCSELEGMDLLASGDQGYVGCLQRCAQEAMTCNLSPLKCHVRHNQCQERCARIYQ